MNYNKVMVGGNLTRDVEVRFLSNGTAVAEFGIAVNRKWKTDDGEDKEEVMFVDCTMFGKRGEALSEHLGKGDPVFIEGRLKFDEWEDKESGKKRSKLKVIAEGFQFCGGSKNGGGGNSKGGEGKRTREREEDDKPRGKSGGGKKRREEAYDEDDNAPF